MQAGTLIKMALRNVWRNKRRTMITGASIMFAVFFASLMRCLQVGAWDYMVHNVVSFHTGYLQVHSDGYWEEQTLNNVMDIDSVDKYLGANGLELVHRVENFALASLHSKTKGVLVVGSEPEKEQQLTHLADRVVEGRYLKDSFDILLAAELSEYLKADIGDSVVILSQGRHGANAAGLFHVAGIVEFGSPELNGQISFISLGDAQSLFAMEGMASSVVVDIPSEEVLPETKDYVKSGLPDEGFEVLDYKELLPDIMQAKEFDELSSFVIIIVLYLLIGFGVFGTLLMMLRERQYEFGILKAIGFKYKQLYSVVWMEIIAIAIGGALAGILLAIPFAWYFQENPIRFSGDMAEVYESYGLEAVLPFKLDFVILFKQALVVTILTTLMSIYAYWKIKGLRAVKAMRG